MKRFIFLICVTLLHLNTISAQQQKEIARFYVTHASHNGNDITEWAVNRKVFTVFYTINDEPYMANVSDVDDDQSWGKEKKPPKIIKLTYSISIGIIQTIMILRKVRVKYNSSKFINHKASFQN